MAADPPGSSTPEQDLAHLKRWSSAFSGSGWMARAAREQDDPGAPRDVRTLARILGRARGHGAVSPAPDPEASLPGLRARALAGDGTVALWLLAPGEGWGEAVNGVRLTVHGLEPGRWRLTWLDDVSGEEIASDERDLSSDAEVAVPAFARHVAAILERTGASR